MFYFFQIFKSQLTARSFLHYSSLFSLQLPVVFVTVIFLINSLFLSFTLQISIFFHNRKHLLNAYFPNIRGFCTSCRDVCTEWFNALTIS